MKTEQLERIRKATVEACKKLEANRKILESQKDRGLESGDVYLFENATDGFTWMIVREHLDDPDLFLVVPVDDHPLVGLPDVAFAGGPDVARCGYSTHIHKDQFRSDLRVKILEKVYVERVRKTLHTMIVGQMDGTQSQWEANANPDYWEWENLVEDAVIQLQKSILAKME